MRNLCLILLILLCSNCRMFDKKSDAIATYKLNSDSTIEILSTGYGATTKDFTEIRIIKHGKNELLKKIEGSYMNYKTDIVRINDTLFKVSFTDTSVFKGMSRSFQFSLNERVKLNNKAP